MKKPRFDKWSAGAAGAGGATAAAGWSAGRERERERERERRAQMAVPEPHDPHSLFGAPVRVSPSASDRVSQQIQMKLGDYRVACRLLDDPRSCPIGIYGEPASPAPVSTSRGSCEFKKPHHTPNGRPHHRLPSSLYSNKTSDGTAWPVHGQPAPPRFHNGTVQPKSIEPNTPQIENILKEMQALPSQPLSAMVATPRKEPDSIFHFNPVIATKVAEEPPAAPIVDTKMPPPKTNLSGGLSSARLSPDVDKDLVVTDSEDEVKATDMLSPVGGGSSSGSESSPSDTDTDSSSDDSKPPDSAAGGASPARPSSPPPLAAPPPAVAPPPVVGPPPPVAPAPSWSLSNFAPPAPAARAPDSDCYDSTREVENALASVKVNGQGPISSLSDSDASAKRSPVPAARRRRHHLPKPPPAPASSDDERSPPPRSSDDEPAPAARKRTKRGRPAKPRPPPPVQPSNTAPALDERCKKRGRPRKQRAARASSEEPRSESDAETPPPAVAPVTDKKKNDTLRKLFTIRKTEEGLGKGGAKGGKGKGQVVIVEAREEEEEEAAARRRRREEEEAAEEEQRRAEELRARLRRREEDEAAAAAAAAEALAAAAAKRRVVHAPPAPPEENSRKRSRSTSGGPVPIEDALQRRLQEEAAATRGALMCRVDLSRLSAELGRQLVASKARRRPPSVSSTNATPTQGPEPAPTNHERSESTAVYAGGGGRTPIYFSYFERLPQDCSVEEDRDHKYYLSEAMRLRRAAESETEPLPRLMLYLESVLCFVLTGRVLELQLDTKKAFTMYRETMEYIKSINSMPSRYRTSPHSTFGKLEILSLRVQALLYLRMFKMYKREVKECYKIVQDYQQKAACAATEPGAGAVGTVSPLSPTPSPAGSVGSVGSAGSASSGYASAPPLPHHALTQLTNYYTFLYIAHELWEQADVLVRNTNNTELFISVDRTCGPLTLHSTFPHLVQYVRTAIARLKERH